MELTTAILAQPGAASECFKAQSRQVAGAGEVADQEPDALSSASISSRWRVMITEASFCTVLVPSQVS